MIDLCLKVFDWAKFRKRKGAIKLHLILDHAGHIPSFCVMTPGREHEIEVARGQRYEPDSILSFATTGVSDHRKTYFFGLSPTRHRSRQPRLWRGSGGRIGPAAEPTAGSSIGRG